MTKWKLIVIAILIISSFILIVFYHGKQFRSEHLLTVGRIVQWKGGNGSRGNFGPLFYYQYSVDGKIIIDSRRNNELRNDIEKSMIGRSFPVAYKRYWYGYENNLLITPLDFKLYGHPFPDSLQWVLQYIKK